MQRLPRAHSPLLALFGLWLASLLLGASCQGSQVQLNGKTYKPKDAGESKLIQDARRAETQQDLPAERRAWKELLQEFPRSQAAPLAQHRLGQIAFQEKRWSRASHYLELTLRGSYLSGEKRAQARKMQADALIQQERFPEAIEALEDAHNGLPEAEQAQVVETILKLAERANDQRTFILWQSRRLARLPAAERESLEAKIRQAIDGSLSIASLQFLYAKRTDPLTFPFDAIALRLALLSYHQRDTQGAHDLLKMLLGQIQQSHPLYPRAKATLATIQRADQSRPNVIGVLYPQTGRGAALGRFIRSAIDLATRGLEGKIQIVYKDTASDPQTAVQALEELAHQDRAIAIFGPVLPRTSRAVAQKAQQIGIPIFSMSHEEGLTDLGDFIFRNSFTLSQMGRAIARYSIKQLSLSRFAVFYPDSPYGTTQVGAFWEEIERLGGKIVGAESYPQDTTSFEDPAKHLVGRFHLGLRPLWGRFSSSVRSEESTFRRRQLYRNLVKQFPPVVDFDAIFIPDTYRYVSMIAPTLAQQDIEVKLHYKFWEKQVVERYQKQNRPLKFVQLLGTNGWNNEDIFLREPRHVVGSIFAVRYFPRSKSKIVKEFIRDYQATYRDQFDRDNLKPPIYFSAYAFDTMKILVHLAAGTTPPKHRTAFRDALRQIKDYPSVTGLITIQPNGEAVAPIQFLVADKNKLFRLHGTIEPNAP